MDRVAAEAFLAAPRIMLFATDRAGKEPFLVAVWYEYRDGRFFIWSAAATAKVTLARRSPAVTLCVQEERTPYKSVIVRGLAEVVPGLDRDLARRLGARYLGPQVSGPYLSWVEGAPDASGVTIVVKPAAWRAADYAEGRQAEHPPWVADADFR